MNKNGDHNTLEEFYTWREAHHEELQVLKDKMSDMMARRMDERGTFYYHHRHIIGDAVYFASYAFYLGRTLAPVE